MLEVPRQGHMSPCCGPENCLGCANARCDKNNSHKTVRTGLYGVRLCTSCGHALRLCNHHTSAAQIEQLGFEPTTSAVTDTWGIGLATLSGDVEIIYQQLSQMQAMRGHMRTALVLHASLW